MIIIELLIFLSTLLPIIHFFNAVLAKKEYSGDNAACNKRMSIIVPCFNEEDAVPASVCGLLNMDYKEFEAIYVNDGSKDKTLAVLNDMLHLEQVFQNNPHPHSIKAIYRSGKHPNFYVIDKQNGGKSEALNAGVYFASSELIVTLDADSVLKNDALHYMNNAFEDSDVVAAGGAIHIMQGYDALYLENKLDAKRRCLITLQLLEYLKGFYIYKLSLSKQKAMAIISGAFGVFRKGILLKAGGFRKTVGEDIDITIHIQQLIHKTRQRIVYLPNALCYTQCPENWRDLRKQRIRWQKGFIDCVIHYKKFLIKTFLIRSLSFHFLLEALVIGICSCLFTILTYVFVFVLAFCSPEAVGVFFEYYLFCLGFNIAYSICAIVVCAKFNWYPKPTIRKAAQAIFMDILFYRYFNLFMYIAGTFMYFWSYRTIHNWNKVERNKRAFLVPKR